MVRWSDVLDALKSSLDKKAFCSLFEFFQAQKDLSDFSNPNFESSKLNLNI